jgi:DNA-binding transcriptional regulator YiaG
MITRKQLDAVRYAPSPESVQAQLHRLGLSQVDAASLLGVSDRTMRRWLSEEGTWIPFSAYAILALLRREG